jgi:hypothetical protein
MCKSLRAKFRRDSDAEGVGELCLEVAAPPFAGASGAWFGADAILDFARMIADTYPLSESDPIELKGGIFTDDMKRLDQVLVGLAFYAVGSLGNVGCRVTLTTPSSPRWSKARTSLNLEILTSYEAVRSFANGLAGIVRGEIEEALLEGYES